MVRGGEPWEEVKLQSGNVAGLQGGQRQATRGGDPGFQPASVALGTVRVSVS